MTSPLSLPAHTPGVEGLLSINYVKIQLDSEAKRIEAVKQQCATNRARDHRLADWQASRLGDMQTSRLAYFWISEIPTPFEGK